MIPLFEVWLMGFGVNDLLKERRITAASLSRDGNRMKPFARLFRIHCCQADREHYKYEIIEPEYLHYPACGQDHHSLEALQVHIRFHVQLDHSALFTFEAPSDVGAGCALLF
eukprot:2827285-Pyramimonas_sp.AAC.1